MCLAIPASVVQLLPGCRAVVDLAGVHKEIAIDLVSDAQLGDCVIVHMDAAVFALPSDYKASSLKQDQWTTVVFGSTGDSDRISIECVSIL